MKNKIKIGLIWCQAKNKIIGKNGKMPWHIPQELKHFKETTLNSPVIMGRNTWLSLPAKYRPLPNRTNIILSKQENLENNPDYAGAIMAKNLDFALEKVIEINEKIVWIMGGANVYSQAIDIADEIVVTVIGENFEGDAYAPQINENIFKEVKSKKLEKFNNVELNVTYYERI